MSRTTRLKNYHGPVPKQSRKALSSRYLEIHLRRDSGRLPGTLCRPSEGIARELGSRFFRGRKVADRKRVESRNPALCRGSIGSREDGRKLLELPGQAFEPDPVEFRLEIVEQQERIEILPRNQPRCCEQEAQAQELSLASGNDLARPLTPEKNFQVGAMRPHERPPRLQLARRSRFELRKPSARIQSRRREARVPLHLDRRPVPEEPPGTGREALAKLGQPFLAGFRNAKPVGHEHFVPGAELAAVNRSSSPEKHPLRLESRTVTKIVPREARPPLEHEPVEQLAPDPRAAENEVLRTGPPSEDGKGAQERESVLPRAVEAAQPPFAGTPGQRELLVLRVRGAEREIEACRSPSDRSGDRAGSGGPPGCQENESFEQTALAASVGSPNKQTPSLGLPGEPPVATEINRYELPKQGRTFGRQRRMGMITQRYCSPEAPSSPSSGRTGRATH